MSSLEEQLAASQTKFRELMQTAIAADAPAEEVAAAMEEALSAALEVCAQKLQTSLVENVRLRAKLKEALAQRDALDGVVKRTASLLLPPHHTKESAAATSAGSELLTFPKFKPLVSHGHGATCEADNKQISRVWGHDIQFDPQGAQRRLNDTVLLRKTAVTVRDGVGSKSGLSWEQCRQKVLDSIVPLVAQYPDCVAFSMWQKNNVVTCYLHNKMLPEDKANDHSKKITPDQSWALFVRESPATAPPAAASPRINPHKCQARIWNARGKGHQCTKNPLPGTEFCKTCSRGPTKKLGRDAPGGICPVCKVVHHAKWEHDGRMGSPFPAHWCC